jgi:hypothetical protein
MARAQKVAAVAGASHSPASDCNPVVFTVVRRVDGTYDVEASDGGPSNFLINFRTKAEAEAWIAKLKAMPTLN